MKELAVILAAAASKDDLVNMLKEKIDDYEKSVLPESKEEAFNKLATTASLILIKVSMGDEGPIAYLEGMDKTEKAMKIFDPNRS